MTAAGGASWKVAYVLTDYPRLAMTFISGEIDEIERLGAQVYPLAMNSPGPGDLTTPEARERQARTLYLKSSPMRIAGALAATFARHPLATARLAITAARSARLDLGQMARRLIHLGYAARAARHCRQNGIRHLHAHFGMAPSSIAWFAAEILNFGGSGRASWSFTLHGPHDFFDDAIARMDLKARSASFVACITDFARSQLCRIAAPADWPKFHVVRCGIDLQAFPLRARKAFGAPPRIVTVGRIAPEKGHAVLLQALKILADQGIDAEVEIIGGGPFEPDVRREAERLGLADRTIFAGELLPAQVSERLAACDVFCMASFAEGLPISIMEAMAVGAPVVCTWISGIPELAVNEATAMTVPPGNAGALAEALRRVIEGGGLRERMIPAARAAVERLHARDRNAAGLAKLFQDQLARTAAAG